MSYDKCRFNHYVTKCMYTRQSAQIGQREVGHCSALTLIAFSGGIPFTETVVIRIMSRCNPGPGQNPAVQWPFGIP